MGTKVSDEFTVPLCWTHHNEIHRTGHEQRWWAQRAHDPLKVAAELWATTRGQTELKNISDEVRSEGATGASANGTAGLESDPTAS